MKINFTNTSFPKPVLTEAKDDYIKNKFTISIEKQDYEKSTQKLKIVVNTEIEDETVREYIHSNKIVCLLHI